MSNPGVGKRQGLTALACLGLHAGAVLAQAPPQAAAGEGDQPVELEEIIVTAQKTEGQLSRVPVSVTAITQESLDASGAKSFEDVARATPGISYLPSTGLGTPGISVRGVSSAVGDATTGIYIDDTPVQVRSSVFVGSAEPKLFDLDRIEVLRGPQGTLFGAGSEGGTIRYLTPQPSLTQYSGVGRVETSTTKGGDPSAEAGFAVGGPIVEGTLGFRASLMQRWSGGWIDRVSHDSGATLDQNINSGRDSVARLAFAWAPTERLLVTPSVYYQRVESDAPPIMWRNLGDQPYRPYTAGWTLDEQPQKDEYLLPSLSLKYDFDAFTIDSITSYFDRNFERTDDYTTVVSELILGQPYFPGQQDDYYAANYGKVGQNNYTQELRFSSTDDGSRLSWVGGLFFQRAGYDFQQSVAGPLDDLTQTVAGASVQDIFGVPLMPGQVSYFGDTSSVEKQYAGFGDLRYTLSDGLKLSVGLRVARVELDYTQIGDGPLNQPATRVAGTQEEAPVTPKLGLSWQLDPATLLYANAAQGYRVGGVNNVVPSACDNELASLGLSKAPVTYDSDSLWSYELGSKLRLLNNRVSVNASLFYIDWSKIQQPVSLTECGFYYVDNLGSATSRGFELETEARILSGLTVGLNTSYTDARYAENVYGATPASGGERALIVRNGDEMVNVPQWRVGAHAEYSYPAIAGTLGYLRADWQWLDAYVRSPGPGTATYNAIVYQGESYYHLGLRTGLRWDQWDLSLFVNNPFDSRPVVYAGDYYSPRSHSLISETSLQPRTLGLTLSTRF